MSYNFGSIDFEHLVFPAYMLVDYIRVYQPSNQRNVGCDPPDFPTADYINTYVFHFISSYSALVLIGYMQVHRGVYEPELDDLGGRLQTTPTQKQAHRYLLNALFFVIYSS
jgi:hypothetical protein